MTPEEKAKQDEERRIWMQKYHSLMAAKDWLGVVDHIRESVNTSKDVLLCVDPTVQEALGAALSETQSLADGWNRRFQDKCADWDREHIAKVAAECAARKSTDYAVSLREALERIARYPHAPAEEMSAAGMRGFARVALREANARHEIVTQSSGVPPGGDTQGQDSVEAVKARHPLHAVGKLSTVAADFIAAFHKAEWHTYEDGAKAMHGILSAFVGRFENALRDEQTILLQGIVQPVAWRFEGRLPTSPTMCYAHFGDKASAETYLAEQERQYFRECRLVPLYECPAQGPKNG